MRDEKSEKEQVKQLYLKTISKKHTDLLNKGISNDEYEKWLKRMAQHLLELNFTYREMTFTIEQAEDQAKRNFNKTNK